jgi:hypothetical protein
MVRSAEEAGKSELRVDANREDRYRTSIAVIGGVIDPLIVEAEVRVMQESQRIIGFHDSFGTGVGKLPIAYQNPEAAGIQIALACGRDAIDDGSEPHRVVGAAPSRALQG